MIYNFRVNHADSGHVDMKCLECGHEEPMPLNVFSELFDPSLDENPVFTRPRCDAESFVPKDVHDQIKGGFVYKVEK